MGVSRSDVRVPTVALVAVVVLVLASLGYGLIIGTILAPLLAWGIVAMVALATFVVYLFYRLVVAVELIADRL